MPRRKESETVQVGLRVQKRLRQALDDAARQRGVSMNAEITHRLERSFAEQDAFGNAALRRLAYSMIVAFDRAGRLRAGGNPDWIDDPNAYRAGMFGTVDALLIGMPNASPEEVTLEIENLKGKLLTRIMAEEQKK